MRRVVKGVVKEREPDKQRSVKGLYMNVKGPARSIGGSGLPCMAQQIRRRGGSIFLILFYFIFYIPDLDIFETRKWINKSGGAPSYKRPNSRQ